jgi:anaerobic selenocysteine-containing dehydrogenase
MPFLRKAQRQGTRLVVIDPRRTRSAQGAELYLAPRPGSDGALALGLAHVIVAEGRQDEAWLAAHTVGWPEYRASLADYRPERVAALTGLEVTEIVGLARMYADNRPALIKIADGLNRNLNGGQNVRAICCLPALTGQYGQRGGGLAYSASGALAWDDEAVNKWSQSPPPGRAVNMNRLGEALLGEAQDPPIKSLFVFAANPVASTPNAGRIVAGLQRADLFTVVHELFLTDTADYADIVLPATSQLEQTDLHKAYGHTYLTYNRPAITPLGESKSNWAVMRLLARAMGFDEPWLQQSADEVIAEVLGATAADNPALQGISLERLQEEGTLPLALGQTVPFADGYFPTPSGKVELFSQALAQQGLPPLPSFDETALDDGGIGSAGTRFDPEQALDLLSGAAHHFVSSSLANQAGLLAREGNPYVEIHPSDAEARGVGDGEAVVVENGRGRVTLRAVVTDAVRPGVLASPKGFWPKLNGGRNINWTTSDALADMAGQSTFHSNRVWLRPAKEGDQP